MVIALKLRLRSLHRQSVFLISSLILIIMIGLIPIILPHFFFRIVFVFFPYIFITLYFDLYLSTWGKAWILSTTLLIFASLVYLDHPFIPFIFVHVPLLLFVLITMFLSYKYQIQQRQLHQRHLKAIRVMLRQNIPLIQTVDYSREAVILLDKTGVIIDSNPQSCLLLSLSESFLIGQPIFNVLGILANSDSINSPENGEFIWGTQKKIIKFRTQPLLDHGIPSGTLLALFDISEAINRMEAKVQIAKFSVINKVSAGLAHEIRNPLTTIKGFMQLITPEQWPESFRPYQQLILSEIQSIDQVLSKFVLLTSPSAPQMQPLNMTECIQTMAQTIQHIRLMRDVTLTLELPSPSVYVMGDHEQLLQALLSLLNNAIEVSPKGGKVIIRLTEYESHVRISVIDYGPGIPKNLRQRVLDPFFTTQADSTGLGLTIACQIILAHHGMLHFSESIPPSGTEAMIDIPCLPKFKNNLSA